MEGDKDNTCCASDADERSTPAADSVSDDRYDPISALPDLVHDRILGLLGVRDKARAAQVCSSLCTVVYRPRYWRQVKVKLDLDTLSQEDLDSLKERKICHVEVLRCTDSDRMKHFLKEISPLASFCTTTSYQTKLFLENISSGNFVSLEKLVVLSDTSIQTIHLQLYLATFANLQALEINGFVRSSLVEAIGQYLPHLKTLALASSTGTYMLDIQGLSQLHSLQTLSLQSFHLQGIQAVCRPNTAIKKLTLEYCTLSMEDWVTDMSSMELEELSLQFREHIVERDELELLWENLQHLKKMTFSPHDPSLLDDSALESVAQMSALQEVCLYRTGNVGDEGLNSLVANLRNLKALTLGNCSGITAEGMQYFQKASLLQKLYLQNGSHGGILLRALSQAPCKLTVLHLTLFADTESEDMTYISQMSTLLDLFLDSVNVGPSGMEILTEGTFNMKALEIRHCGVTMQSLMPLLERQTSLQSLTIVEELLDEKKVALKSVFHNLKVCTIRNIKL